MTSKVSSYRVRLTDGLQTGGTVSIPYKPGDAQADFDTSSNVNVLIVRRAGGRDERPIIMVDHTDTFLVTFGASDIQITWREDDVSIGDTDDITFVFNLLSTFAGTPLDALLLAIASLVTAADKLMYFTGVDTVAQTDFTAVARTLLAANSQAAQRTAIGVGTIATQDANNVSITGGTVNGAAVTGLATPSAAGDAANKSYVDAVAAGLKWKQSVRVATTANGTLASAFANGQTIDDVVLATGDRILLKNQSSAAENGIYTVNASGAPTRATDADSWSELVSAIVAVEVGTTNADTAWNCTSEAGGTLGVTSVSWSPFAVAGVTNLTATEGVQTSAATGAITISLNVNGLSVKSTPHGDNDKLPLYDDAGNAHKYSSINQLLAGTNVVVDGGSY